MHLAKSITIVTAFILLCGSSAFAQPPRPVDADRPTQRWLPPPPGDAVDLSGQAQLLQQLRDMISSESSKEAGDSPLPKLSEQQLREMEKAVESMRELIGKDKLPNLESIPKEWIDQALSDPILRKQAQQLLEQYARDRKVPSPSDRTPRNSEGVPLPRRQPNDKPRDRSVEKPNENRQSRSNPVPNSPPDSLPKSNPPRESMPDRNSNEPVANDPFASDPFSTDLFSNNPDPSLPAKPNERSELQLSPNESRSDKPSRTEERRRSEERSLPAHADAERIEALQELFKKLKSIEGQRQLQKNDSGNANSKSSGPNKSGPKNSLSSNNNRAIKPNSANDQSSPALPPRSSSSGSKPGSAPLDQTANPSSQSSAKAPSTKPNGTAGNAPRVAPPLLPSESENSNSANSDFDSSNRSKSIEPTLNPSGKDSPWLAPGSRPSDARVNKNGLNSPDRSSNAGQRNPLRRNESSPGSGESLTQDMDIKTQLERHGLGRALQRIVEKTMKEQGDASSAKAQAESRSASLSSKAKYNNAANSSVPSTTPSVTPTTKSTASRPTPQNSPPSSVPSSDPNSNRSSTMSSLRNMAAQFWGAVRSAPGESRGGSSASSPNITPSLPDLSGLGSAWSGRVWLLLGLLLVLIAMLLLIARKRVVLATAAEEAEAELAKEILTEGIRTRADVVRAFHRFVLRRAQPVANWWTHRYAALRLTESSPQLRSVIADLASVYEHARYLPPEATLSSEEIDRVQAALKQCAASSV